MIIKHKSQRVAVLVDVQNLYHSAKNLYSARVNFENLLKETVCNRQLIRAIAYVVKSDEPGEASFFDALTRSGWELRSKDLQIYPDGLKKADWDVGMAVDAIRLSNVVDAIVLVTGDGDFIPLLEHLRAIGRQVELAAFSKTASTKLKELADDFLDLDSKPDVFLIRGNVNRFKLRKILPI
ncbi:MAG: NYN domain-containing protein [Candidatus Parcubacteria bacterium]|nr:NYN domain-containing protein [Candidatus Parcubacteria bacterium]